MRYCDPQMLAVALYNGTIITIATPCPKDHDYAGVQTGKTKAAGDEHDPKDPSDEIDLLPISIINHSDDNRREFQQPQTQSEEGSKDYDPL